MTTHMSKEEQELMDLVDGAFRGVDFGNNVHKTIHVKDGTAKVQVSPLILDETTWVFLGKYPLICLEAALHQKGLAVEDWELKLPEVTVLFLVKRAKSEYGGDL